MEKSDLVVGMDVVVNKHDNALHYTVESWRGYSVMLSSSLPEDINKNQQEFDVSQIEKPNNLQLEYFAEQKNIYKNNSLGWMVNENLAGRNTELALDARDALFDLYQGEKTRFETWGVIGEDLESGELKGKILNSGLSEQSKEFVLHAAEAVRLLITFPHVESLAKNVELTDTDLGVAVVNGLVNFNTYKANDANKELFALYKANKPILASIGSDVRSGKIYDVIAGLSEISKDFIHDAITPIIQMLNPKVYFRAIAERIEDAASIAKHENESGRGAELDNILADQNTKNLGEDAEYDKAVATAPRNVENSFEVKGHKLTKEQTARAEFALALGNALYLERLHEPIFNDVGLFEIGKEGRAMTTLPNSRIHYNDSPGMLGAQIINQDGSTIDFGGLPAIENFHIETGLTQQELYCLLEFEHLAKRVVAKNNDLFSAREIAESKQDSSLAVATEDSMSEGRIMGVTEHYVVQNLGRNAIIHAKSELSEIPEVGKIARIDYKAGVGHVEVKNKIVDIER